MRKIRNSVLLLLALLPVLSWFIFLVSFRGNVTIQETPVNSSDDWWQQVTPGDSYDDDENWTKFYAYEYPKDYDNQRPETTFTASSSSDSSDMQIKIVTEKPGAFFDFLQSTFGNFGMFFEPLITPLLTKHVQLTAGKGVQLFSWLLGYYMTLIFVYIVFSLFSFLITMFLDKIDRIKGGR